MTDYREIIRLHSLKFSNVAIANSLCCSRNTVSEVLKLAETHSLEWPIPETLTNRDIEHLFYPGRGNNEGRRLPDYEYVYNELAKPGVTLSLLWAEYCAKCEAEHTIPYQHSQFNDKYHAYAASKKATLRIKRKPGETMEVDWVGDTLKVYDAASCSDIPAYIFVAVLPCSLYGYAEAFPDMKSNHWIEAHIHAYLFFGGVTRILVPDNLKTGVIKNTRTELILNRSYHEMAEHYGTAIIPARPVKPKDKPNAEGTVKVLETWILAALRNRKFFTFDELNKAIHEKLEEFNAKPFQKKKGSKKKHKGGRIFGLLLLMVLVVGGCAYAGASYYFSDRFFEGTWINGVNCSRMTAYEVENLFKQKFQNYSIEVSSRGLDPQTIAGDQIDYQYLSTGEVLNLLKQQKPYEWIKGMYEQKSYTVSENTGYNKTRLQEQLKSLNCAQAENQTAPENAYVAFKDGQFVIVPETEGSKLNIKQAYQVLC